MGASKELFAQEQERLNLFLQPAEQTFVLPIESITLLNAEKSDLSEMASLILESVDDGNADPIDVLILAKKGKYVFDAIVEGMKGKANFEDKNFTKHNVVMRKQDTGVRYYYDGCNDEKWNDLNIKILALNEELKQREEFLKSLKGETKEYTNEETGEVETFENPVYPPSRVGTPSLICTIK